MALSNKKNGRPEQRIGLPSINRSKSMVIESGDVRKKRNSHNHQEEMPEYSPTLRKNSENYRKILMKNQIISKEKSLRKLQTQHKKTRQDQLSVKKIQLIDYLKNKFEGIEKQLNESIKTMKQAKIPDYIQYYFLKVYENKDDIREGLLNLNKLAKNQQTFYHRIKAAFDARKKFIEEVRFFVTHLKQEEILPKKEQFQKGIRALRLLTASLIDNIKRWRESINYRDEKPIFYTNQDCSINALIDLLNDTSFILVSTISRNISIGTKNDPFFLSPIKKSLDKQYSPYLEIFQLPKPFEHYQKYMEYLASEKAYELSHSIPEKPTKQLNEIQQIYVSHKKIKKHRIEDQLSQPEMPEHQRQEYRDLELKKSRLERLHKNQERINLIRNVYERDPKKRKRAASQIGLQKIKIEDEMFKLDMKSPELKIVKLKNQEQFDKLVNKKYRKQKKLIKSEKSQDISHPKIAEKSKQHNFDPKQQQMIENVRDIEKKLKLKIKQINMDDHQSHLSPKKSLRINFKNKSQHEIVTELKTDIISKIEEEVKEKQKMKRKRKEEEEKMLVQIKEKMKKQLNEKLEQKRKEKMIEKEELQKRLEEEEKKLQKQRELQLQFQTKLAKERELRHIEKIKREAIEREQRLKQQLEKQTQLRKVREEAIQKERREKDEIIKQLKLKEVSGEVEMEVKQHVFHNKEQQKDSLLDKVEESNSMTNNNNKITEQLYENNGKKSSQQQNKQQKQESFPSILKQTSLSKLSSAQQQKDIQKVVEVDQQDVDKTQEQIKKEKQEQLKKQIELIKMREEKEILVFNKEVALRERLLKVKLAEDDLNERELQNLVRAAILDERKGIKSDALNYVPEIRQKVEAKIKEEEEIEKAHQIEIDKIKKQRQLEQDEYRKKIREKIEKQLRIEAITKTKKQIQARQSKQINEKQQLHANFLRRQKSLPLRSKSTALQKSYQEQQRERQIQQMVLAKQSKEQLAKSSLRQRFEQELLQSSMPSIYRQPQKNGTYLLKSTDTYLEDNYLYEKLQFNRQNNLKEFEHVPLNKSDVVEHMYQLNDEQLHVYNKQKKKIQDRQIQDATQIDQQRSHLLKQIPKKKDMDGDGFQLVDVNRKQKSDSEDQKKYKVQVIKNKEEKKQKSSTPPEKKKQLKQKKFIPKKQPEKESVKQSEKRKSSEEVDSEEEAQKQKQSKHIVYYDAEQKEKEKKHRKNYKFPEMPQISVKKLKPKIKQSKYSLEIEAIPEDQLDEYLQNHFIRLPLEQTSIIPMDRQQLYRKLVNQLTFCLVLGQFQNRLIGMAFAYHDRMRYESRRLIIPHISTYSTEHLKGFILETCDYLFRKDPCDQIQFVYQFNQNEEDQKSFAQDFNKWFDKYGHVYQKKLDDHVYQRKYVYKRQFNQECEVVLRGVTKSSFSNIFSVYSGVLMSDAGLSHAKDQLKIDGLAEDWVSYGVMVSQLFRNFMNPEDAQILKNKVKQVQKLKQLLILVVMLQKKKMKLEDLKLYSYKNLIELNMRLMSQGKQVIRYAKDTGVEFNQIFYCELNFGLNLPFGFQTTSLPTEIKQDEIRQISYFRLNPLATYKLHLIKSSLYNSEMHLLPTQNSKTKLFLINASEYLEFREKSKIDLFMYTRFFMKNVRSHTTAAWKYIWVPEMISKGAWQIREFRDFFKKDMYVHDNISLEYKQFLPNALIIEPQHRDLVITPPFIIGIMSMNLEQVTEGSPIYARLIDSDSLKTIEIEKRS